MMTLHRVMPRRFAAVAAVVVAACGTTGDGDSSDSVATTLAHRDTAVIDGTTPACRSCSLEVSAPLRLGSPEDGDIPQQVPSIIRDSRGFHYLVFNGWGNKPILRYDTAGRFLGRLGRYGRGPGEYTMTTGVMIGPADSVFVFTSDRRGLVYAPDGAYARVQRTGESSVSAIAADGSGELIGTAISSFESWGSAPWVRRIARDGSIIDSFPIFSPVVGISTLTAGSRQRTIEVRLGSTAVPAPDGSVWGFSGHNYRLERHGRDGTPRQLIGISLPDVGRPLMTQTDADSMVAARDDANAPGPATGAGARRPQLRAKALGVGDDGLLWVVRTTPAPRSDTIQLNAQHLSPDEAPTERTIPRDVEDRLYHTIVEVIDPRGPQLLARTELPFLGHAARPGYVARVTQDESGHYVSSVYRLVLHRR